MSILSFKPKEATLVWLEPGTVHAAGRPSPCEDPRDPGQLAAILGGLPPGPVHFVVDDAWIPSLLVRDLVEVPKGAQAREAFFRWRYARHLGTEVPQFVQALALDDQVWLLAGMAQDLRDAWLQAAAAAGRPIHRLIPRWLWLYNRLAPTLEGPGMLLSLCPLPDGTYSGTLAVWGLGLILLRQWAEPVAMDTWQQERVLPTLAYLQREGRLPLALQVWGAQTWPEAGLPVSIMSRSIPAEEAC